MSLLIPMSNLCLAKILCYFTSNRSTIACSPRVSCEFFQLNWSRKALHYSSSSAVSSSSSSQSRVFIVNPLFNQAELRGVLASLRRRVPSFVDRWIWSLEELVDDVIGFLYVWRDKSEFLHVMGLSGCVCSKVGNNCSMADVKRAGIRVHYFNCSCSSVSEFFHCRSHYEVRLLGEIRSSFRFHEGGLEFGCRDGWHHNMLEWA